MVPKPGLGTVSIYQLACGSTTRFKAFQKVKTCKDKENGRLPLGTEGFDPLHPIAM